MGRVGFGKHTVYSGYKFPGRFFRRCYILRPREVLKRTIAEIDSAQATEIVLQMLCEKCAVDIKAIRQFLISLIHHETVGPVCHHGQQTVAIATNHLPVAPGNRGHEQRDNLDVTQVRETSWELNRVF